MIVPVVYGTQIEKRLWRANYATPPVRHVQNTLRLRLQKYKILVTIQKKIFASIIICQTLPKFLLKQPTQNALGQVSQRHRLPSPSPHL